MLILHGLANLKAHAGKELGASDWVTVTQHDVDQFAALTGDRQWIHVDVDRAAASQFGTTIVHGYLTLALVSKLGSTIFKIEGFEFGLNYGVNKVRFPAPLPVGRRVRLRSRLVDVAEVEGGVQVLIGNTFDREGTDKPVCVAETVIRYYH